MLGCWLGVDDANSAVLVSVEDDVEEKVFTKKRSLVQWMRGAGSERTTKQSKAPVMVQLNRLS